MIVKYIKFSCWTSILLLLWGVVLGVLKDSVTTWCAFAFFCLVSLGVWAMNIDKKGE